LLQSQDTNALLRNDEPEMGVIASQSRESKARRAAIATTQLVIAKIFLFVIARRAKPDEAIAFMVLSLKVFGESSKGVFPLLRTKAIAFMVFSFFIVF
jgi:hypothetical protein